MKDISLYGHLTIDTIVDGVKEKTLGSMANVWKALLELDAPLILVSHLLMWVKR